MDQVILQLLANQGYIFIYIRNLYTFGSNDHGQLGLGDTKDHKDPKIVDFFQKKNIKVKDAICG